jgi:hypothetical protein
MKRLKALSFRSSRSPMSLRMRMMSLGDANGSFGSPCRTMGGSWEAILPFLLVQQDHALGAELDHRDPCGA